MQPAVSFVLRGRTDRFRRQRLYLRFSFRYKTNYISTKFKLRPEDWDAVEQRVKSRATTLSGDSVPRINLWLEQQRTLIFRILLEENPTTFPRFKELYCPPAQVKRLFGQCAAEWLDQAKKEGLLKPSTARTYSFAVKAFLRVFPKDVEVSEMRESTVALLFNTLKAECNENLANQYLIFLRIIFNKILKIFKIGDKNTPFQNFSPKVKRISEKKSLSIMEYRAFWNAFLAENSPKDREILRRFLIQCRGLRFSDTVDMARHHCFTVNDPDSGKTYHYLSKPAQKTDRAGIVPLLEDDVQHLLIWQDDGRLFAPMTYKVYRDHLASLSLKIIGRKITTHYGRHFAGDFILNAPEMSGITDVKMVLGVSSTLIAETYAQRDILKVLQNFHVAVANNR